MAFISTSLIRPALSERIQNFRANLRASRERRALYNRTVRELELLSDRDLADLGIARQSIHNIAYEHAYEA